MIAHLVLAAGEGRRVGGAKGALDLCGTPLLTRVLDAAAASKVDATYVVVGADAERVARLCARPNVVVVRNDAFRLGQTSSLQAALRELPADAEAFLIHPVDYALVGSATLDALCAAFRGRPATERATLIARPKHGEQWGHPVLYARVYAEAFLALKPETSARVVYRERLDSVLPVAVDDDACLYDLDTPEDRARFEARIRTGRFP
jgi:molybdenum cofactor cytidylyltransferase